MERMNFAMQAAWEMRPKVFCLVVIGDREDKCNFVWNLQEGSMR